MKKIILILFVLMCLAQWLVPAKMIYDQENILSDGKLFKFITAPIDPTDPFRGKYITLSFEANNVKIVDPKEWIGVKDVYVSLYDSAGFARISTASMYEPEGTDYIKATVSYVDDYNNKLWINYPFDRFYLEESKAAEAERLYWQSNTDSTQVVYALVSVKQGQAALKDVMINNRKISDIVTEINQQKEKP